MRPPMVIVLFSASPEASALLAFRLTIRFPADLYRAYRVEDAERDLATYRDHPAGLVLVCLATPNDAALLQDIKTVSSSADCPVLVIDPYSLFPSGKLSAEVRHLTAGETAPSLVFDHLALMKLRKRGPKAAVRSDAIRPVPSVA